MNIFRRLAPFTATFLLLTLVALALPKDRITIKGSDTMVILVQRWTEVYPDKTNVEFQVTGGGSGTGIAALINGTTDICSSSRPIKKDEIAQLEKKYGYKGLEIRVAMDGLAIYVHKSNSVKLTFNRNQLSINANTPEVGESRETMALTYKGKDMSIAFNPGYLMDPLKALDVDEVYFELIDELSPGVLKSNEPFLYVIMPMRMS